MPIFGLSAASLLSALAVLLRRDGPAFAVSFSCGSRAECISLCSASGSVLGRPVEGARAGEEVVAMYPWIQLDRRAQSHNCTNTRLERVESMRAGRYGRYLR